MRRSREGGGRSALPSGEAACGGSESHDFTLFYTILLDYIRFTLFYTILQDFILFNKILQNFIQFYKIL